MNKNHSFNYKQRACLYGNAVTAKHGGIIHADMFGASLPMRSSAPPPIAEYDAYLERIGQRFNPTNHRTSQPTGYKLRRIVVMRRDGATWKECASAISVTADTAKKWASALPPELAV